MNGQVFLRAQGLRKNYPGMTKPAVAELNIDLKRGELLGLLGPNGAGKTTTISMLSTLISPDSGTLNIANIDALQFPQRMRSMLGVVPQGLALYPTLTLEENLRFFGRLYGLSGSILRQRIDECSEFVALADMLKKTINTFSGGMKRRANLAAGIVHQPELLFLDEPTVGIDPQSRHQILANLRELNQQGMTMVYTTHYMDEVQQLCSRVMIVDGGTVLTQGGVTALLKQHKCDHLEELFLRLTGKQLRD
ncbi:MAG: ABC transporter ATP-binding protein [Thermodesulfobacteriota bacterium]|nr:ABC transporter ATP-binding protein [Thermodesulfobacteriota bacterium]